MLKEDYVSFEVAKLLKEKGFDESCRAVYEEEVLRINTLCDYHNSELSSYVSAPTHQMACAWIREKYGFHIFADYDIKFNLWKRNIREIKTGVVWSIGGFSSPEETVEEGVKFVLENLI